MLTLNHSPTQGWSPTKGCLSCDENTIELASIPQNEWPTVLIGVQIPTLTPFLAAFLKSISDLEYPKDKIDLFIHNGQVGFPHIACSPVPNCRM